MSRITRSKRKRPEVADDSDYSGLEDCADDRVDPETDDEDENLLDAEPESPSDQSDTESDDGVLYSLVEQGPFVAKSGMQWQREPDGTGKTRACDKMNGIPGVRAHVRDALAVIVDSFLVFFTRKMKGVILIYTNKRAAEVLGDSWRALDEIELDAFLGILLLHGVFRESVRSPSELWHVTLGRPIYNAAMAGNRFTGILRVLRFDNTEKVSRLERQSEDKLAPIRKIWNLWVPTLTNSYVPFAYVTVDEQLFPFRGRCAFKQYIPNKPSKYGTKNWVLADSDSNFCLNIQVYTGKSAAGRPEQNQGRRVVLDLVKPLGNNSGRNVTCDNFFTDVPLAEELLKRNMTVVGTVRKNKTDVPPEFLPSREREPFSSVFGFTKDLTLVSYVPKKGKGVILLSSLHHDGTTDPDDANKPEIIQCYNKTKAGVDTLDQLVARYSSKRKSNRWPMVLFYDMIDLSASNALVVWTETHPEWRSNCRHRRRIFLKDLGEALLNRHIRRRLTDYEVGECTKEIISKVLDIPYQKPEWTNRTTTLYEEKARRCKLCGRDEDRKTKFSCKKCKAPSCQNHIETVCVKCFDNSKQ